MGNPTSINWNSEHFPDGEMSINSVKWVFRICKPSLVFKSHLFVKSIVFVFFSELQVVTLIRSEFRILQIVEVDSRFFPIKTDFPNNLLISVDFPEHVSPEITHINNIKYDVKRIVTLKNQTIKISGKYIFFFSVLADLPLLHYRIWSPYRICHF